jgi:hypothetical protein
LANACFGCYDLYQLRFISSYWFWLHILLAFTFCL